MLQKFAAKIVVSFQPRNPHLWGERKARLLPLLLSNPLPSSKMPSREPKEALKSNHFPVRPCGFIFYPPKFRLKKGLL